MDDATTDVVAFDAAMLLLFCCDVFTLISTSNDVTVLEGAFVLPALLFRKRLKENVFCVGGAVVTEAVAVVLPLISLLEPG